VQHAQACAASVCANKAAAIVNAKVVARRILNTP
jgi:hypothetical protein